MLISTLQENLKNGISIVNRIAGKNSNLPILNNILFDVTDGEIKLITTDLDIGIICTVRGKVEKEGKYTVDAKIISDYISVLPNKKIDINKNNNKLIVECDTYKTNIKGQEADEYPLIPEISKDNYLEINKEDFKKALAQVINSVSNNENRIELTGVLLKIVNEDLILASTDSFRLSEKKIKITDNKNIKNETQIIIPSKTIQEVLRIISNTKEVDINKKDNELKIYISENQILFSIGNTEIISKLIEGQYPDYQQIIPEKSNTKIMVNKNEFIRSVKAASIFSKNDVNDINIDLPEGKNKIIISSSSGLSGENTSEIEANVNGVDNGMVVNYKFLLDGINNIDGENLIIEIVDNNTPCVLKPEKIKDYSYVIMPIKQ